MPKADFKSRLPTLRNIFFSICKKLEKRLKGASKKSNNDTTAHKKARKLKHEQYERTPSKSKEQFQLLRKGCSFCFTRMLLQISQTLDWNL